MSEPKQYLCSHLVSLVYEGRRMSANMEKIWSNGATFNAEEWFEPGAPVRVESPEFTLNTQVVRCTVEDDGYFLDVEFESGYRWTPELFQPKHLTDTDLLLARKILNEFIPR